MPYCAGCGTQITEGTVTCLNCGRPVQVYAPPRRTDGQAVASLALGIAGLVICPFIPSIIAVVLGTQALQRLRVDPTVEGESLARAGVILGWVGIGIFGLGLLFVLLAVLPLTFFSL